MRESSAGGSAYSPLEERSICIGLLLCFYIFIGLNIEYIEIYFHNSMGREKDGRDRKDADCRDRDRAATGAKTRDLRERWAREGEQMGQPATLFRTSS